MEATTKDELKAGDVVVLKSGGPPMTIDRIDDAQAPVIAVVHCTWFAQVPSTLYGQGKEGRWAGSALQQGAFAKDAVRKVDDSLGDRGPICPHCRRAHSKSDLVDGGAPNEWRLQCRACGKSSIYAGPL
jgi:uncharacterized protein YodC (DUF2158 family)